MLNFIFGKNFVIYAILAGLIAAAGWYFLHIVGKNAELELLNQQQQMIIVEKDKKIAEIRNDYKEQAEIAQRLDEQYNVLLTEYFDLEAALTDANLSVNTADMTDEQRTQYLKEQTIILQRLYEDSLKYLPRIK